MDRFTDDLPFNFDTIEEKPHKEWRRYLWPIETQALPKCITSNAERDPTAEYGLNLLRRASQMSSQAMQLSIENRFVESLFSHDQTLKLIQQARKFQQNRILSPQKSNQAATEPKSPLKLKIIRKRSRKLSKTSKTDSTSEGRNEIESWNLQSPVACERVAQPSIYEMQQIKEFQGTLSHEIFWVDNQVNTDYLGIEKLIF